MTGITATLTRAECVAALALTTSVNGRSNPRFRTSPGSGVVRVGITSGSLPFALEAVVPLGKLVLYLLAREGKVTDAHAQVVGVPKPKDPGSTRPIAMASALVRGFHLALLSQFPSLPSQQWCGLSGSRTADAIADWLALRAHRGAELDLRRAFDSVPHAVSLLAGRSVGFSEVVLAYFSKLVWPAPRRCSVAAVLLLVMCGLFAACHKATPPVLCSWHTCLRLGLGLSALRLALLPTFTPTTGVSLKLPKAPASKKPSASPPGKRQLWTAAVDRPDSHWVEHLGLHVKPGKACLPETRTGPADVERLANVIAAAPGTALTRERFASWRRALRPSSCTWWCTGRVWADSITAHPVVAAAFACLREAARPRAKTEPVVTACVRHHAATLGLSLYGMPPAFHLVLPPHDDPRLVAASHSLLPSIRRIPCATVLTGMTVISCLSLPVSVLSPGQWVLVLLYTESSLACHPMMRPWAEAARRFPSVKFMKGVASEIIPDFPDSLTPTVIMYKDKECIKKVQGLAEWGGSRVCVDSVEWVLAELGIVQSELEEDPRAVTEITEAPACLQEGARVFQWRRCSSEALFARTGPRIPTKVPACVDALRVVGRQKNRRPQAKTIAATPLQDWSGRCAESGGKRTSYCTCCFNTVYR
eukprot:s829_g17.t1